jgi:hypothetical protein
MADCCNGNDTGTQWIGSKLGGASRRVLYLKAEISPIKLIAPNILVFASDPMLITGAKLFITNPEVASGAYQLSTCATVTGSTTLVNSEYRVATDLNFIVGAIGGEYVLPPPVKTIKSPWSIREQSLRIGVSAGDIDLSSFSGRVFTGKTTIAQLSFAKTCDCCLIVTLAASITSATTFPAGKLIGDSCGQESYCYEIINTAAGVGTPVLRGDLIL